MSESKDCEYCRGNNVMEKDHPYLFDVANVGERKSIYGWIWRDKLMIRCNVQDEEYSLNVKLGYCPNCGRPLKNERIQKRRDNETTGLQRGKRV